MMNSTKFNTIEITSEKSNLVTFLLIIKNKKKILLTQSHAKTPWVIPITVSPIIL